MIPLMLAEGLPPPNAQFWYMFCSSVGVLLVALVAQKKLQRQPPIEADLEKLASKLEVQQAMAGLRAELDGRLSGLSRKIDSLRVEIHDERRDDKAAAETRINGIHRRMDELRADIIANRDAQVGDTKNILSAIGEIRGEMKS